MPSKKVSVNRNYQVAEFGTFGVTFLATRPRGKSRTVNPTAPQHFVPRHEAQRVIREADASGLPVRFTGAISNSKGGFVAVSNYNFGFADGRAAFGCMVFNKTGTAQLRKWALA